MNEIIDRNWVHPNLHIKETTTGIPKSRLFLTIDYWKEEFLKNSVRPGSTIGIALSVMDDLYIAALFAAFEYRLKIVILLKPSNKEMAKKPRYKAFMPLDVCILDTPDNLGDYYYDYYKSVSKIVIYRDYEYKFPLKTSKKNKFIVPDPKDDCFLCTSSGSTGDPKEIHHSHKFFYNLCSFNAEPLGFTDDDRVLHISTFHHGSALGIYFLPSIRKSKFHFFHIKDFDPTKNDEENWNKWLQYCQKYKITKVQSTFSKQTDNMISAINRSKDGLPNLTIMCLSFINPNWLNVIKQDKLKKIVSVYGCSESSGPIFLPYIDKNTNADTFNPKFLGKPIEGFHSIHTNELNELIINIPTYPDPIHSQDYLRKTDEGYYFLGKTKLCRINDILINAFDIEDIFDKIINKKYSSGICGRDILIIVDEIYNKLYAVCDKEFISDYFDEVNYHVKEFYNQEVSLEKFIFIEDLNDFVTGIKIDKDKMLDYIRLQNNDSNRS